MQAETARVHQLVRVGIAVVMCMGLAVAGLAQAAPVIFQFGGTIQSAGVLNPPIFPNTTISGAYTVDSTTPDMVPGDPSSGIYALSSFSVNLLGRTYSMVSSTGLRELRVINTSTSDTYSVLLLPAGIDKPLVVLQ